MADLQKNPFEHASRSLLKRVRPGLICWLTKVPPSDVNWVGWLDTRLTVPGHPERVCDTIAHVRRQDQDGIPWAIPVEFQAEPDSLMLGREWVYSGLIWLQEKPVEERGDRFQIMPVIVNLTGRGDASRRMAWLPGHEMTLLPIEWNLASLDAEVILDQVECDEAPHELLAWVSLMQKGGEPITIERWLALAEKVEDPEARADLAFVAVFAQLTDRVPVWKKALEGFNVTESVVLNEWMDRAASVATIKSKIEDLVVILEDKFASLPDQTKAKIEATTERETLQRWVLLAARATSLEQFLLDAGL